jgi:uncharacterized membrane protein YozB (DUF420 family)
MHLLPTHFSIPELKDLPTLNATLNSAATLLLVCGYLSIRLKKVQAHLSFMVLALVTSVAFLTSYLYYHAKVGDVKFQGTGFIRYIYYPMLISHVLLAMVILPMVILTLIPVLRRRFDKHRRIARWTLPIWLYVSVTGVLVYLFCYIWFP